MEAWKNQLFFGDNLDILRSGRIPVGSVDLIYLDPPFNSNATYNISLCRKEGREIRGPNHRFRRHLALGPGGHGRL
jgi:16S rRNA G966 N2-methylase RsmD